VEERQRPRRFDLGEQLDATRTFMRSHRRAAGIFIVVGALGFASVAGRPISVGLADLAVGDCLFIRTGSAISIVPASIPIGSPDEAQTALAVGDAETASCAGSHGHEVSLVTDLDGATGAAYPGSVELREQLLPRCLTAFETFVGRPAEGSAYDTAAVVPHRNGWNRGNRRAVCLVFGRDGRFLDHQARDSGE